MEVRTILIGAGLLAAVYVIMSIIAFCFYAADKAKAKKGAWRIPEKVLLLLGFLGGGLGALLGMHCLRHKTKHWYFWVVNIAGLIWQAVLLIVLLIQGFAG